MGKALPLCKTFTNPFTLLFVGRGHSGECRLQHLPRRQHCRANRWVIECLKHMLTLLLITSGRR
jgi:hypothetical protein